MSSSEPTNSSTDQMTRVKNMFIHLHHIWDEWSSTTTLGQSGKLSKKMKHTEKLGINRDENQLTISQKYTSEHRRLQITSGRAIQTPMQIRTGQSVDSSSTFSDSQVSAPIVGRIRDARCKILRRYSKAMSTGFGNVLIMKFNRVWRCGYMFGSKGTLSRMWINGKDTRTMRNLLGRYRVGKGLLVETTEPYVIGQHYR